MKLTSLVSSCFLLSYLFFCLVVIDLSEAQLSSSSLSLRSSSSSSSSSSTTNNKKKNRKLSKKQQEFRQLQSNRTIDLNGGKQDDDDLSSDGFLLNEAIKLILPIVNAGIQAFTPDPLDLNIAGTLDLGTFDVDGCGTNGIQFPYNWGGITGLSNFFIESLEVIPGTEFIEAGCLDSAFSATFRMAVASLEDFIMDDLGAGFEAVVCNQPIQYSINGDIITNQPFLSGAVDLAGSICGGFLEIDYASILESLVWDYNTVEASIREVPDDFKNFISDVTREMSVLMKGDLIQTVEPTVRPIIEEQLQEAQTFAPGTLLRINAGFVRNAVQRRIGEAVSSARSFLGLGGGGGGGGGQ